MNADKTSKSEKFSAPGAETVSRLFDLSKEVAMSGFSTWAAQRQAADRIAYERLDHTATLAKALWNVHRGLIDAGTRGMASFQSVWEEGLAGFIDETRKGIDGARTR
jgi:hypothetical protein